MFNEMADRLEKILEDQDQMIEEMQRILNEEELHNGKI